MDEAVAYRDALGIPELIRRSDEAMRDLPPELVFAGFSMGVAAAEYQAANRPGAPGAVLMDGALPAAAGGGVWPRAVPVAVHYAEYDPEVDPQAVKALCDVVRADGAIFEQHVYPGSGHLFADPDAPEYDAGSAALMWECVLAFLDGLERRSRDEG